MSTSLSTSSTDGSSADAVSETPPRSSGRNTPPPRPGDAASPSDFMRYLTDQKAALLKIFRTEQLQGASARLSESTAAAAVPPKPSSRTCEEDLHGFEGTPVVVAANPSRTPPPAWGATPPESASGDSPFSTSVSNVAVLSGGSGDERMSVPLTPTQNSERDSVAEGADSGSAVPERSELLTTSSPMHTHQLRPTRFFLPTLCEVCVAAMVKERICPQPQSQQTTSTTPQLETAPSSTPSPGAAAVAAAPSQPFLGFGMEGYRCCICGLVLHLHCIIKMRQTQPCDVLAPAAHQMPSFSSTSASSFPSPSALLTAVAAATGIAVPSAISGPFSWDRLKTMLGSYLDRDDGAYSRHDANAKAVLAGVCTLIDTVIARYPTLTPLTFVKRYPAMQDLSNAHQALYAACAASLDDTALLHSISWDAVQLHRQARTGVAATTSSMSVLAAMRPLRVDNSLFANLKASVIGKGFFSPSFLTKEATTPTKAARAASDVNNEDTVSPVWPVARYPVQLLLWQAMRYATAVYGEVYRRGSLSSALSATLLFTLNRSSVDVSKQANDAAVTTLLELPPSALRLSRWSSQTAEPSYALLVDDAAGRIVVSFRGTLNTFDIMTDLAASTQPFCGGYAHQGAAEVVSALFDQRASRYEERAGLQREKATVDAPAGEAATDAVAISAGDAERCASERAATTPTCTTKRVVNAGEQTSFRATGGEADDTGAPEAAKESVAAVLKPYTLRPLDAPDGLLDGLEQLAAEHPSYSILITGHSLGGGVALLFGTRLHYDQVLPPAVLKRLHVIAFAPMPTLSLPAASCFDEVSCARADGGYSCRDAPKLRAPGAACFPMWSVVNGFDCVPRLQLNTIDRLLRQVVGPQAASSAEASTATGSSTTAPAAAGARHQVLRGSRERDALPYGAAAEVCEEMEMTDMPAPPTKTAVIKVQSPRIENDAAATAAYDGVEGGAPASLFAMSDMRAASGIAGAGAGAAALEEADVVVRDPNEERSTSSFTESRSVSSAGSTTPRLDELCTPVNDGAQGASNVRSSPSNGEDTSHSARGLSHELHHPGRVLLLTSPWDIVTNRLVDVPRGHPVMHELFLVKSMLMQHMVDAYSASLEEIHEDPRRTSGDERSSAA
ncbi:hypothetical protein GH5_04692 [Leishmania sp. Ghana 2012 LV757]|uniref:hypothetical protein n=1 Tax=Leishmania sp. Ghana 2012 LV757 TaxID=2803181 RepID=UPI001B602681|nr:hypothetical protein GH5_04692 [Leishmania sp. Ghana 2012 LV757]